MTDEQWEFIGDYVVPFVLAWVVVPGLAFGLAWLTN